MLLLQIRNLVQSTAKVPQLFLGTKIYSPYSISVASCSWSIQILVTLSPPPKLTIKSP